MNDLYGQAQGLMGGTSAPGQAAQGGAGEARNAWLSQLSPGGNPYFEKSVQGAIDSATQGFTRNVLPELDARGVGMGQYGGARDNLARGEAAGMFAQGLSRDVGGMYANQYAGDQNRALQALGMSQGIQGMQTQPLRDAGALIGGPTVLGQSQNTQGASNWGSSIGQSFGQSWNQASSNSAGSGKSAGIGVGGK
ncbi:MAG: hypothetical protein ACRC1H_10505 [Caldilineaceae bacterium]